MKETHAASVVFRLDEIFANFGLPRQIISDNSPPFQSTEMKKFMNENGIGHHTITPMWPQTNEAETVVHGRN